MTELVLSKKLFATLAEDPKEYLIDFCPSPKDFRGKNIDVVTFHERTWCNELDKPPFKVKVCYDNVAVAEFSSYDDWLKQLKCETRARIKRSVKRGLTVKEVAYSDDFAFGVWVIFNESKIRQDRLFKHYGESLENIRAILSHSKNIFIGAYQDSDLVGFIELATGDCTGQILQFLSLSGKRHLLPNNALIAKAIEVCANHNLEWLVYARMGNHPSLDEFKRNNGFKKIRIKRFFIPLTLRGKLLLAFGLQRSLKDSIPAILKPICFRLYNYVSQRSFTS